MSLFNLSEATTTRIFQTGVLGLMSFIAFHVYQNDIHSAVITKAVAMHEKRITTLENRQFDHLTRHPTNLSLPIAAPLVHTPKRKGYVDIEDD